MSQEEQGKGVVLVVDDEAAVRETIRRIMEQAGYRAVPAADGEEAQKELARREFDVALLDVRMPGTSGMKVLEGLRWSYPDTSVIMVTAAADVQTVIEAMTAGAYDYVIKPFNLEDLVLKVGRALERRKLVLQNRQYQRHLEALVEEQRERLRKQFVELIGSLAREHALLYEMEGGRDRRGRGREPLSELPPGLREPKGSVQEFAAALLRLLERPASGGAALGDAPAGPDPGGGRRPEGSRG